jgi:hypothetical protein
MADTTEFYLPGGDGKWDSAPVPETLEEAQERIRVLQQALGFYCDARSYNPDSGDNEYPNYDELLEDKGIRARISRLAATTRQFDEWSIWASRQDRRF